MALKAKDIAELLGVSTAAVSIVVNNKPGVSAQKRQEILKKIKELDCEYLLKDGVREDNGTIGFVVFRNSGRIVEESPFFTYILEGITNGVNECGYKLVFLYLNKMMPAEEQNQLLRDSGCSGFMIFGVEMKREDIQPFVDIGLPFCVLDNSFVENDVDSVAINNAQGTGKALQYLYACGHRRIGYVRCKTRINSFEERYQMYRMSLEKLDMEYREDFVADVGYSEHEARADIRRYLDTHRELPTAFFVENDFLACSIGREIQEMGYQIPEDISLIGFDDRPIARVVTPQLTTMNVPKDIFGPTAVKLLMDRIQNKRSQSMKVLLGTNLVERESVKRF